MEITAIGGYSEFGRNMTCLEINGDLILLDAGLDIESYSDLTEGEEDYEFSIKELKKIKAILDITTKEKNKVKAIIFAHAHLDHIGALMFISKEFKNATIIGTPFTIEVIKGIYEDSKKNISNELIKIEPNESYQINKDLKIELINTTHSIPQSTMVALHTKENIVIYASDFKLDETPTIGELTNMKRLEEIGREKKPKTLIVETTYAAKEGRTPSEKVAKELLEEVLELERKRQTIIVTTFASHIARLKTTMEYARKINRKPVFMGRSMERYLKAAENTKIAKFTGKSEVVKYKSQVKRKLQSIEKEGKEKYLIICTGHQAEPNSTLRRISTGEMNFKLTPKDLVVFSCSVIPTQKNIENRKILEQTLRKSGVKIYTDIHQSGHAAKEELKEVIAALKPERIFPTHGDMDQKKSFKETCDKIGIECTILKNGEKRKF